MEEATSEKAQKNVQSNKSDKVKQPAHSHSGHRKRLRDRFIREGGLDSFQPHNALELLLFYGIPRMDTNDAAHSLMDRFGSLNGVFNASADELQEVDGIGKNAAALIHSMSYLFIQYQKPEDAMYITSTEEAAKYLISQFTNCKYETFIMLCLNNSCRLVQKQVLSDDGRHFSQIDVSRIISTALNCNAAGVIFAHNHPEGLCLPSREDADGAHILTETLESAGIVVLNHIIISGSDYYGFAEHEP